MQVLLVNPPSSNLYRQMGNRVPPLGVTYLAAVLREAGHSVEIIDLDVDTSARIDFHRYGLVGITANTTGYRGALEIARSAKEKGRRVVMGGYHVTFQDEEALRTGLVDYVVRGEGEHILLNLVDHLEDGRDIEGVSGLSFMKDGQVVRNPNADPISDLDGLPLPARDLLPMDKYEVFFRGRRTTSVITSRGCPFNCSFCVCSKFAGLKWRARSAKSIADEVEHLKESYGYSAFAFMDDNFTLNPKRVMEFTDELDRRGLDIIWWCFSRVDTIVENEDIVRRMAEAGAKEVFLGLESGTQDVLDGYGKRITVDGQRQAVSILKRHRIDTYGSFIIGDLRETDEMIEETIDLAVKLNPYLAQFSILTPYPGTVLFERARKGGMIVNCDWDCYDGLHAVMRSDFLSAWEIQKMLGKAYRRFYFRFSLLLRLISDLVRRRDKLGVRIKRAVHAVRIGWVLLDYLANLKRRFNFGAESAYK